jgi:[acyl-carrier-protein] S-malonyltransferase
MRAFLFPGQGSQEVGMGADLFRSSASFRSLVEHASHCAGEDLEPLCLRGPESKLRQSKFLQPLMVCVSLGYCEDLAEHGLQPDIVLGHSLGEISALAAAGVITPAAAVAMAAKRGALMDEAALAAPGGMLAVTTHTRPELLQWLTVNCASRQVVLANDNAPTQIVLSGELSALSLCADAISRQHLGKCHRLPISGPWHSPFLEPARQQFERWAQSLPFRQPKAQLLMNLDAECLHDPGQIRRHLTDILVSPVRWADCMTRLRAMAPSALFEVGPGRILSGLARANGFGNETPIYNVNNLRGVELAVAMPRNGL